ncbi:UPF0261 protein [Escovopsis weberi]|uniref:UPF0261 protein n=1 Tax=Escovopsis weberi TaxID=150374 RepID=A0A0M8MXA4_ESCWE|nr:UPF0261 protein [Escovopsis weberi]
MASVVVIGTLDTKLRELLFLCDRISEAGATTVLIDVGRYPIDHPAIATSPADLLSRYAAQTDIHPLTRAQYIELISGCASQEIEGLLRNGRIHGVVSAGGSGNTSLASGVMRRALPLGFPKLIVSTMASGDTGPTIGETDITLMYSVVDVAGLNHVLRQVLANAGAAIAGAARAYADRHSLQEAPQPPSRKRVAISMFGVTTPGVDAIREHLEATYPVETLVFHATGHGGRAMENAIREGHVDAVIDLTTTEICDYIVGGVLSAGEGRLDAAVEAGIPNIVSLGALDMCNFGPMATVPDNFRARKLYAHNKDITLMRTSPGECEKIGDFICRKLMRAKSPATTELWIPRGGLSAISVPGGPFADQEADQVLFATIERGLQGSGILVVNNPADVNDHGFSRSIAETVIDKMGLRK